MLWGGGCESWWVGGAVGGGHSGQESLPEGGWMEGKKAELF